MVLRCRLKGYPTVKWQGVVSENPTEIVEHLERATFRIVFDANIKHYQINLDLNNAILDTNELTRISFRFFELI